MTMKFYGCLFVVLLILFLFLCNVLVDLNLTAEALFVLLASPLLSAAFVHLFHVIVSKKFLDKQQRYDLLQIIFYVLFGWLYVVFLILSMGITSGYDLKYEGLIFCLFFANQFYALFLCYKINQWGKSYFGKDKYIHIVWTKMVVISVYFCLCFLFVMTVKNSGWNIRWETPLYLALYFLFFINTYQLLIRYISLSNFWTKPFISLTNDTESK